jgi:hypothetical protein
MNPLVGLRPEYWSWRKLLCKDITEDVVEIGTRVCLVGVVVGLKVYDQAVRVDLDDGSDVVECWYNHRDRDRELLEIGVHASVRGWKSHDASVRACHIARVEQELEMLVWTGHVLDAVEAQIVLNEFIV